MKRGLPGIEDSFIHSPVMTPKRERIFFLDNLRSLIMVWVVVLHGAITYMEYPPTWYPVVDPQRSLIFTVLVMLVEPTLMTAMFFIAAYFALPSIRQHGAVVFLKSKLARIGVPWVLGVVLVVPPVDYLFLMARHSPVGLLEFCTGEFWREHYHQGPFWFLGGLMFFFLLFTLACRMMPGLLTPPDRAVRPTWQMLSAFWALMTLGMFAVQACFGQDGGFHLFGKVLAVMPSRIHLYSGYFVLGLLAWRNRWFTAEGYTPRMVPWLVTLAVSMLLYSASRALSHDVKSLQILAGILHLDSGSDMLRSTAQMTLLMKLVNAALFNAMSLSALMGFCALFKRHCNSSGPAQRSLSDNSFGIYFIHSAVLYPVAYVFLGSVLPLFVKATVVITLGFFLSWAASALLLRRTPFLRRFF